MVKKTEKKDIKKVAAVVLTYNRKELLKEGIEALIDQKYEGLDIYVVDNHSTDGTKEYISDLLKNKKVFYVDTGENLGCTPGFCIGIRKACEGDYDYIWLMDDDCIVQKDALKELLQFAKEKKDNFGLLASKVLWKDNSLCKMNIPRKTWCMPLRNLEEDSEIVITSFVSMFIKKSVIEDVGLPIKEFVIWTDDYEFSRRISMKYPCYFVHKSIAIHKSKDNFGANIVKETGDRVQRYNNAYRNEYYLYRREGFKGRLYVFLRNIYTIARIILFAKECKKEKINIVIKATNEGKKFFPAIEYLDKK